MASDWILNFDSAPFCNGSLHVGHARNYVLGDVRARWLRLRGDDCWYTTAFDAFGLPNTRLAGSSTRGSSTVSAGDAAARTAANVRRSAGTIQRQFHALGLTHASAPPSSCDPGYYRWTQWLFLQLWSAGFVYWQRAPVHYCPACESALAPGQSNEEICWRCGGPVIQRRERQCFVRTSAYQAELTSSIDTLSGWSTRSRKLLRTAMTAMTATTGRHAAPGTGDWVVSRKNNWGTPLPAVDCESCGVAPVAVSDLPVLHIVHGGSRNSRCRSCGSPAVLVDRTLDCFFDDAWCFYAGARHWTPGDSNPFARWRQDPPREVHFHAGYDTYAYLPLYRFVGRFLWEQGHAHRPEPIDVYHGHDVVTSRGNKISKRYGNGPDLDGLLGQHGSDVVRLSVLVGTNPSRPLEWSGGQIQMASRFVRTAQALFELNQPREPGDVLGAARRRVAVIEDAQLAAIDRFIGSYRMAAALDRLYTATRSCLRRSPGTGDSATVDALRARWLIFCPQLARLAPRRGGVSVARLFTRRTA